MEGDEALCHKAVAAAPPLPEVDRGPRQLPVRQRLEPGQRGAGGRHQGVVPAVTGADEMKYNRKDKQLLRSRRTKQCTVGDEGVIGDLSSESITAHLQGVPANVLLIATTWSGQIWISG